MRRRHYRTIVSALAIASALVLSRGTSAAGNDELTSAEVKASIERGQRFLLGMQNRNGSFGLGGGGAEGVSTGCTSLVVLALLSSGMNPADPTIAESLRYLRESPDPDANYETYQVSLKIMALAAAHQPDRDNIHIAAMAQRLQDNQIKKGESAGMWNYGRMIGREDNSNTQFAILGLREAAIAGIPISRKTWELASQHFVESQNYDGGWGYRETLPSTGSMTCSGIGSLTICEQMLQSSGNDTNPDGTPRCCQDAPRESPALRRGLRWLDHYFTVASNPGQLGGTWTLYYLYGVEHAGRLSGRRFFGRHDWYREGARFLLDRQSRRNLGWTLAFGDGGNPTVATSFALLFLAKGLSPVVINKLNYGLPPGVRETAESSLPNWNLHPNDARNLAEFTSRLPRWPKLMTVQEVEFQQVVDGGSVRDLLQAPVLYISGLDAPHFSEPEIRLLREYVEQGGFIFAVDNCSGSGFDQAIRSLVPRFFPPDESNHQVQMTRLPPEHPIYRSEFPLDPQGTELWGVNFGCRTSFVYSPQDHSCLWEKWSPQPVPKRTAAFELLTLRSMKVGANVIAYATGREPYDKLDAPKDETVSATPDRVERGLLQVAKLRHTGDWDAAPRALRNVLIELNRKSGMLASTRQRNLAATDPNLFRYPLAYMHGRLRFQLKPEEIRKLREYLGNGPVLFADACCGSAPFDESFRKLVQQLYPERKLERIPITHELFSQRVGFDIHKVKRRIPDSGSASTPFDPGLHEGEPFLEGIEIDGRYTVIYSKYDISCAIERQASVACAGYDHADAVRIAVNVIRYALLQDISYAEKIR